MRAFGEVWQAQGETGEIYEQGSRVTVTGFDGLVMQVRKPNNQGD